MVLAELAATGAHGAHRIPLADLTVAVAAQVSGVDVVHYDRHFERLGELLDIRVHWIADPEVQAARGSAPDTDGRGQTRAGPPR